MSSYGSGQSRAAEVMRSGFAAVLTLAIGCAAALDPSRAATVIGTVILGAVAITAPQFVAASSPAIMLFVIPTVAARLDIVVPLALLSVAVIRSVSNRTWSFSVGQWALVAFSAWVVFNLALHFRGLSEGLPPDVSPIGDAATLVAGLVLGLATSLLEVPRRYLLAVLGCAMTATAVVTIIAGSPQGVLFGLNRNYLGMVLALGFVIVPLTARRGWALLWIPAGVLMGWAMILLESRGATVAASVGVILAVVLRLSRGRPRRRGVLAAGAIVAFVLAAVAVSPSLSQTTQFGRTEADLSSSDTSRFGAVQVAIVATVLHPVVGVGYGRFGIIAYNDPRLNLYINTHDDFLRIAAELGLPGIALFLLLIYSVLKGLIRTGENIGLVLAVTYLVGLLFANTLSNLAVTTPFWLYVGIGLRGSRPARELAGVMTEPSADNAPDQSATHVPTHGKFWEASGVNTL